jgi:cell division transport system permease protein
MLGLQGGVIGGGAAALLFLLAHGLSAWFSGSAAEDQVGALFGQFSIGAVGYVALIGDILLIAVVTAVTSRYTVNRTLEAVE